jgi:inhibitor of KinA
MRWAPEAAVNPPVTIRTAGDAAFVITLPAAMDEETSARAIAIAQAARRALPAQLRDVVVGYHTVTVYFDPLATDGDRLSQDLAAVAAGASAASVAAGGHLEIPVCYGGELGPDLEEVAGATSLTPAEVIDLHTSREYRVFVIGFVPGFAYMGPLAPPLAGVGRRASPRTRVPAGSVAIAGGQTGIYPMETPGGWRILGRTPILPFDETRTPPVLFAAGDRVRFRAIDRDEFDRMSR